MDASAAFPKNLSAIIALFDSLDEAGRRESLVAYAESAGHCAPRPGESFALEDIRKDEECTDTVGIHLRISEDGTIELRITLGPKVQTLTRAMAAILCKGLAGATPEQIRDMPSDFVRQIIGGELVRLRSQTVYYVLSRIKTAVRMWLDRQRVADVNSAA